jgi:hypothetical protein
VTLGVAPYTIVVDMDAMFNRFGTVNHPRYYRRSDEYRTNALTRNTTYILRVIKGYKYNYTTVAWVALRNSAAMCIFTTAV